MAHSDSKESLSVASAGVAKPSCVLENQIAFLDGEKLLVEIYLLARTSAA